MLIDEKPYIVIADSMCNELGRYRQQCPTRDRQYDNVTSMDFFEIQELHPVDQSDYFIAYNGTKLRW